MTLLLLSLLTGCEIASEKLGIYGCDEYCPQLIDRAAVCAEENGITLGEFMEQVKPEWAEKGEDEILTACDDKLIETGKTESECKAETGTFNNLPCDDILTVVSAL